MVSEETLRRAAWLENVALRCIFSEHYFTLTTGHKGEFWPIAQNSLGEAVCVLWSHVFGNRSDDLHYTKFFSLTEVTSAGTEFSSQTIKRRILKRIGMNDSEYEGFWREVKDCRDQFVAHKQLSSQGLIFPHINVCREMMEEIRAILADLFECWNQMDSEDNNAAYWVDYYAWNRNESLRRRCQKSFFTDVQSLALELAQQVN